MAKTMQIDYVRSVLEYQLKSFAGSSTYFNDTDISLYSFYEQLTSDDEVNRYVQRFNDLVKQQNKMDLVGFGILTVTDNPTITNLKSCYVSPFEWSCTIRCTLANRDKMISTINRIITNLKGKKQDVAELSSGKLVPVGTLLNNNNEDLEIQNFDFIGTWGSSFTATTDINSRLTHLNNVYGLTYTLGTLKYVYGSVGGILKLFEYKNSAWVDISEDNIPTHASFSKNKIDLSLDEIKVDEPFVLDATQFCTITFGGSATLTSNYVRLGNDLVRFRVNKYKIKGASDYNFTEVWHYLEPLEMPSGLNANTIPNQLRSNFFKTNTHTDSIAPAIQYTFLLEMNKALLRQWFIYGRYGINNLNDGSPQAASITPNVIYQIQEFWCAWGEMDKYAYKGKIVEDIDIESTESDVMTLGLAFQVQGDND